MTNFSWVVISIVCLIVGWLCCYFWHAMGTDLYEPGEDVESQSDLWKGEFGDAYHERNVLTVRCDFWYAVLGGHMMYIKSVLEVGAGKGDNLISIRNLSPWAFLRLTGVDINEDACEAMEDEKIVAIQGAFPHFELDNRYDLVLTRGFLIHVPPADIDAALEKIYTLSNRYIVIAEYYSPARRAISYRGLRNALWTDDYAGRLMKAHPDLTVLRTGFDYEYGITWFLLEKPQ